MVQGERPERAPGGSAPRRALTCNSLRTGLGPPARSQLLVKVHKRTPFPNEGKMEIWERAAGSRARARAPARLRPGVRACSRRC